MKKTHLAKTVILLFLMIVTLNTGVFARYSTMTPSVVSEEPFLKMEEEEDIYNEPKLSTIPLDITKTADILDGRARSITVVATLAYIADEYDGLVIMNISDPNDPVQVGQFEDGDAAYGVYVSGSYAYVADSTGGLEIIDVSNPFTPAKVGHYDDGGDARGVFVSGSYAYLADGSDGLEIIDVSDPTDPIQIGQFFDGGFAYDVQVVGSYAYVADGEDGLEIIDISDPTTPYEVRQIDPGRVYDVHVAGAFAYVASDVSGLTIIDVTMPTSSVQVGQFNDGGSACSVYVAGLYAYMAEGSNGWEIINASDPTKPLKVGQFNDGGDGTAYDICVSGLYAYVADGSDGLEIIDVSNPSTPPQMGQFDDGGYSRRVFTAGSYAYVSEGTDGLEIIDISDPINPVQVGEYNPEFSGLVEDVFVSGSTAYVADWFEGLLVIWVDNPANPQRWSQEAFGGKYAMGVYVVGSYIYVVYDDVGLKVFDLSLNQVGGFDDGGEARDIFVSGTYAYVAEGDHGLEIIDVSNPTAPFQVGQFDDGGFAYNVHVVGLDAYVADGDDGLEIIDVSDPTAPMQVGQIHGGDGTARDVNVVGSYAYIADGDNGLEIIDVSDPSNPIEVGQFADGGDGYAGGVMATESYAYVADGNDGLEIIDVSDLTPLMEMGQWDGGDGAAYGVCGVGSYVYVADMNDGVIIIDISDPTHPIEIGQCTDGEGAIDVYVAGLYAFIVKGTDGLAIIDISDPTTPVKVGQFNDGGYARGIFVVGSYVYLAEGNDGLVILNISDPTTPIKVGQFKPGIYSYVEDVYVEGSIAYITDFAYGLVIIDVSDPTTPIEVGRISSGGYADEVYVEGSYAYVADGDNGLEIFDISNPNSPLKVGQFNDGSGFAQDVYVAGTYAYLADDDDGLEIIDVTDPTTPIKVANFNDGGNAWSVYVSGSYAYVANEWDGLEILHVTEGENVFNITVPNNSVSWNTDSSYYIYWESIGFASSVDIELYQGDIFKESIASDISNGGQYYWTIPLGLDTTLNYQIKIIEASNTSVYDYSEFFEIYTNSITVTSPNSTSALESNSSDYIYWESTGYVSTVDIELYKGGSFEIVIASDVSNEGQYYWTVPSDLGNAVNYQVKISEASDSSIFDFSENFEIYTNSIIVTGPDSSSSWAFGSSHYIYWESIGYISTVDIELYRDGVFDRNIASNIPGDEDMYYWTLPLDLYVTKYQVKIIDTSDPSVHGYSDIFRIYTNTVTVLTPDSYSSWLSGSDHKIFWVSTGYISQVNIELYRDGIYERTIYTGTNDGIHDWRIPSSLVASTNYQVKISDRSDPSVYHFGETFEIYTGSPPSGTITITNPAYSPVLRSGTSHFIYWESSGDISTVNIKLYKNGYYKLTIDSSVSNEGIYYWTVPLGYDNAADYQIRIADTSDSTVYDYSDYFEIYTNSITVTSPTWASNWKGNSSHNICWESTGYISRVNIELYRDGLFKKTIASNFLNDFEYEWEIPSDLVSADYYQIKITDASDSSTFDFSRDFEIWTNYITITAPDTSSTWVYGSSHDICWDSYWESLGDNSRVNIDLYRGGLFVVPIASEYYNREGVYTWTLPTDLISGQNYQIKITDDRDSSTFDFSENFEIPPPIIAIENPSNSLWEKTESYNIIWFAEASTSDVRIELYNYENFVLEISAITPNDGQYLWEIPISLDSEKFYQIKILDASDESVYGISSYFEIINKLVAQESSITGYPPIFLLSALGISIFMILNRRKTLS